MSVSFHASGVSIRLRSVSKDYRTAAGAVHALRAIDLDVVAGEAVAVMGPSGCGKTTLLNLIAGMDRPDEGTIVVDGDDIARYAERRLETYRLRKVGVIFQFFNLIPTLSATENLELPMLMADVTRDGAAQRARQLLATVGLADKGDKRPEELSGGEQQRVAIALALVNDPALIIADEPTGNLDTANLDVVASLLLRLSREHGKTVLVASHDPKVGERFPKLYRMRDGRFEKARA